MPSRPASISVSERGKPAEHLSQGQLPLLNLWPWRSYPVAWRSGSRCYGGSSLGLDTLAVVATAWRSLTPISPAASATGAALPGHLVLHLYPRLLAVLNVSPFREWHNP